MKDTPATHPAAIDAWELHLQDQVKVSARVFTFDMDDGPERAPLAGFDLLNDAIQTLDQELKNAFQTADAAAIKNQATHRTLAKWAIWTGAGALLLAIVQPALAETLPDWKVKAGWLEGVAAVTGLVAVLLGTFAKINNHWFIQRHRAERLRMLKFLALGRPELWCGNKSEWKEWLRARMDDIAAITTIQQVKQWAESGEAEVVEPSPPPCTKPPAVVCAYSTYYRWKRVEFQAAYFHNQAETFRRQSRLLIHLPLPLFFMSIGAVGVHFFAEWMGGRALAAENGPGHFWHQVGIWALAVAALLPVCGLCVRVWLGAFEHIRSANLFEAKGRALSALSAQLERDQADLGATIRHVAHIEHFLEHEHREWLRLLLEAEWFL
jgi:hypothetical protein